MRALSFTVLGKPAPKGSSRAMMTKTGKAVNVASGSDANKDALQSWAQCVRFAAIEAVGAQSVAGLYFGAGPLRLQIVFRMKRTGAHFRKNGTVKPDAEKWHVKKPDLSKLIRSTEDAMAGIVMLDDNQISELLVRKVFADPGKEGAWIKVEEIS
jgi:Holliday junction resolvase RusA-like endonuclease